MKATETGNLDRCLTFLLFGLPRLSNPLFLFNRVAVARHPLSPAGAFRVLIGLFRFLSPPRFLSNPGLNMI